MKIKNKAVISLKTDRLWMISRFVCGWFRVFLMVGDDGPLGHCPLWAFGMETKNIITTLERKMYAIGVCSHRYFEDELICAGGPVFLGSEQPPLEKL